jgi:hypothetical protein
MSLQRFIMDCMQGLATVVRGTIAIIRFFGVLRSIVTPLTLCGPERITMPLPTHLNKAHFL